MPKDNLILRVKFTKIGDKIKYELPVRMFCGEMRCELPHTGTFSKNDLLFVVWLGHNTDRLFKKSDVIYRKVNLVQIYDSCDSVRYEKV